MRTVVVTGANGFVGRTITRHLIAQGFRVRAIVRSEDARCALISGAEIVGVGDMTARSDWRSLLRGASAIVHLAGRVHRMGDLEERAYFAENVEVTKRLALAARAEQLDHFVFFSSIKVNGERTEDRPFSAEDSPHPQDAYGRSKLAAETELLSLDGLSRITIVRPPLVYGPGVGANFQKLMKLVASGIPLPFGRIHNRRSIVNVWNLADLVHAVLGLRDEGKEVLLVSDDEALSTPDLIRRIARSMNRRARLLSAPLPLLNALARVTGRARELSRLTDSLVVDMSRTRASLDWSPPVSLDEGLVRTVKAFSETAPS